LDCWFAKARCTKCLMDPKDDIDQWFLSARDKGRKHRDEHHGRPSLRLTNQCLATSILTLDWRMTSPAKLSTGRFLACEI
jgi:hypothetical protein